MSAEYTPTTEVVRNRYTEGHPVGIYEGEDDFNRWLDEQIVAAVQQGYKEALRNAAETCANYSGHPYNAAATLALGFSMAVDIMEKED